MSARVRGLRAWLGDLVVGVRLVSGAGRASLTRLALAAVGIGVGVAILLGAAAVPHMLERVQDRDDAQELITQPRPGTDALETVSWQTTYEGRQIEGLYVQPTGPNAPMPPGVQNLPGPGEIVVSPALAELLGSGTNPELLAQLPQRLVGIIDQPGLRGPGQLYFYAGGDLAGPQVAQAYGFGAPDSSVALPTTLLILVLVGVVVLLVPVLSFVTTSFRVAGAERDRRLAAVRLVGASRTQTRRIAAAEALLAAVAGLVLGAGLFLLGRAVVPMVRLDSAGLSVFSGDVRPSWILAMLIIALIPALALGSAVWATRTTTIEPLSVVRRSGQTQRRLWWRLVPLLLGPLLIAVSGTNRVSSDAALTGIVAGTAMSLLGLLAVLPWLLQYAVRRLRAKRPSWQLAIGRLNLDCATPARVVGGLAVVLSGAVALQTVLLGAQTAVGADMGRADPSERPTTISAREAVAPNIVERARSMDEVGNITAQSTLTARPADTGGTTAEMITVANCASIQQWFPESTCHPGDAFALGAGTLPEGAAVELIANSQHNADSHTDRWRVPPTRALGQPPDEQLSAGLLVTPEALPADLPERYATVHVTAAPGADAGSMVKRLHSVLADYGWQTELNSFQAGAQTSVQQQYAQIRTALLAAALLPLGLAGVNLLALAAEQIRERRRPLAMLAATGVPRGVLARSLLWQQLLPTALAIAFAIANGTGLGLLVTNLLGVAPDIDWTANTLFAAGGLIMALSVTLFSMPVLRAATHHQALQTE